MHPECTISRPTTREVERLWQRIAHERAGMLSPPESLGALVEAWGTSMLLFSGICAAQTIALFLVRDPQWDAFGDPISAWITLYVVPEARHASLLVARAALDYAARMGFRVLWTGCRHSNRRAQYLARLAGFTYCARLTGDGPLFSCEEEVLLYVWNAPLLSKEAPNG